MTSREPEPYRQAAEILFHADVSTDAHHPYFKQLPSSVKTQLVAARLRGCQPAFIRWPTGQVAIVLCGHGSTLVSNAKIIAAYKECLKTSKQFPKGEFTCLP